MRTEQGSRVSFLIELRSSKLFVYTVINLAVFTDAYLYGLIIPVLPFALVERVKLQPDEVQRWIGLLLAAYGAGLIIGARESHFFVLSPMSFHRGTSISIVQRTSLYLTYSKAIAGWFADRTSSRRGPYLLGLIALAFSTLAFSLGQSTFVLFVGRLVQGGSSAAVHTVGMAILADTVGQAGMGPAMGFVGMSIALGVVLGPMLGGILYHRMGYFAVFGSAYALVGLDFVFRVFMVTAKDEAPLKRLTEGNHRDYGTIPGNDSVSHTSISHESFTGTTGSNSSSSLCSHSTPSSLDSMDSLDFLVAPGTILQSQKSSSTPRHPILVLLSTPRMLAALLGDFAQSMVLTGLESILPLRIKTMFHYNSMQVALIFLALSFGSFAGPATGRLSDRIGAKITVCFGFGTAAPLLILLRLVDHDSKAMVALLCSLTLLLGVSLNMILTPSWSDASYTVDDIMRNEPGIFGTKGAYAQAFGLMNMAYATGSLVGPLLGGFLVEHVGWNDLTLGTGIFCALCVVPCLFATGGRRRQGNEPTVENREHGISAPTIDN